MVPKDPAMLVSWLNMKMRDEGVSFGELCCREDLDMEEVSSRLKASGYCYDPDSKRFR
ncbi:MAG: DUF4250 domain-containing protein [Candidatus Cryptobacteroides sp.]